MKPNQASQEKQQGAGPLPANPSESVGPNDLKKPEVERKPVDQSQEGGKHDLDRLNP